MFFAYLCTRFFMTTQLSRFEEFRKLEVSRTEGGMAGRRRADDFSYFLGSDDKRARRMSELLKG